jgi:large conductance mechanosensitive channel
MLQGFKAFLTRGNILDLAVAVVIGVAFNAVVASLVSDLITPLVAAIFGQPDFSGLTFAVSGSTVYYGRFLNALLSFVTVAAAVYFVLVKPMQRLRLGGPAPGPSPEVQLLTEIRDLLHQRESGVAVRQAEAEPAGGRRAG